MTTAWVIMANDRPRGVHLGSKVGAQAACERLRKEHYMNTCSCGQTMSRQAYRAIWYWRVYHPGLRATTDHD